MFISNIDAAYLAAQEKVATESSIFSRTIREKNAMRFSEDHSIDLFEMHLKFLHRNPSKSQ